jgi:hypothetical protein
VGVVALALGNGFLFGPVTNFVLLFLLAYSYSLTSFDLVRGTAATVLLRGGKTSSAMVVSLTAGWDGGGEVASLPEPLPPSCMFAEPAGERWPSSCMFARPAGAVATVTRRGGRDVDTLKASVAVFCDWTIR